MKRGAFLVMGQPTPYICIMKRFGEELLKWIRDVAPEIEMILDFTIVEQQTLDIFFPGLSAGIVLFPLGDAAEIKLAKIHELSNVATPRVIHLWEDLWMFQKNKVKSRLRSLLKKSTRIYGRETITKKINNVQLIEFLKANHLNVPIKAKYKYGLFYRDEIVAVMSFSKSREIEREGTLYHSYELLRFCNKLNVTVVGGMTKLLHHFIETQHPDDVMTYVDCDWSDGQANKKAGFELAEKMPPMEFWLNLKTGKREYPQYVLKQMGLKVELPEDAVDMERFLAEHHFVRVYNSGSFKFILKLKK